MTFLGRLKSRKFQACAIAFASACAFLWTGKIDGSVWRDTAIAVIGIYVAGNVAQKRGQLAEPPEATP